MKKTFKYPDAKQVLVCGDIHGNFKGIVYKLCIQYGLKDTLLIVAGDCGFGFEKPGYYETVYNQVAGRLRKANNWVVFVRGNHDDPSYFAEEKVSHERWRCVPDYSVVRACGRNVLCVGGATSLDRKMRKATNGRLRLYGHAETAVWWEDEAPVFSPESIEATPEDIRIDAVVTHTAPSFCELQSKQGLKSWAVMDPSLIWDTDQERQVMDEIFSCLREHKHPVEHWYYGHFHQSWRGEREGIRFAMLDIEEFLEIPSATSENPVFDPDEVITLPRRGGEGVFLHRISEKEYELCGDLKYSAIHYGDEEYQEVVGLDPPGGPFLYIGRTIAGKTIKGIRCIDDRYFLELQ